MLCVQLYNTSQHITSTLQPNLIQKINFIFFLYLLNFLMIKYMNF